MAIIKIKPIKHTVKKAIDYIIDDKKTDFGNNVYSDCLAPEFAYKEFERIKDDYENRKGSSYKKENEILAYHIVQSFDVKEKISEEEAVKLGQEFAEKYFKGNYKFVVATHNDKNHIHNHIIVNSFSHNGLCKYRSIPYKTIAELKDLNDKICLEHGYSIIENTSKNKAKSIDEIYAERRGKSYKKILQMEIDYNIKIASDFNDFLKLMKVKYDVKDDRKYISFRRKNTQERFTRCKTIGEDYSEERIKERILFYHSKETNKSLNERTFTSNFDGRFKELCQARNQIRSYEKLLKLINKYNIKSVDNLYDVMNITETEREDKNYIIKKNEKKIMLFEEVINSLTTYNMYKDILSKYKKTMSKDYYEKYRTEITLADKSKKLLEQYKVPLDADESKIEDKINEIKLVIDKERREAEDLRKELRDMKDIKFLLEELTNKKNKDKNMER